ncbi:hypothetical protein PMIN04_007501 [Paraphaeosphaeria minitans]
MSLFSWSKSSGQTVSSADPYHQAAEPAIQKSTQGSLRSKLRSHLRIPSRDPIKRNGSTSPSPATPTVEHGFDAKSAISQRTTIRLAQDRWEKALRSIDDEDVQKLHVNGADRITILKHISVDVEAKKQICVAKHWKYTKSNGEVVVLRDVFDKIAMWVERFKQIGDVVAQYDATNMSLPWAGIRLVLQVAVNDVQTFGAMAEGVEFVSDMVTRCAIIEDLYLQGTSEAKTQLEQAVVKLYTKILQYVLKARRYYSTSTAGRLASGIIHTPGMVVEDRLHSVSKAYTNVSECMRLVEAEDDKQVKESLEKIQDRINMLAIENRKLLYSILNDMGVVRMSAQVSDLHTSLQDSTQERVIQWLSNIPYLNHHRAKTKDCLPGSGNWLLKNSEFLHWKSSTAPAMIWLHGIPGSGKTTLVSSVIEHLKTLPGQQAMPVSYFYCTRDVAEPERSSPEEIMRCILEQLSSTGNSGRVKQPVIDAYKQKKKEAKGRAPEKLSLSETTDLILELLEDEPATIVIDALDECDPTLRPDLILALKMILVRSESLVKVFVSGRYDGDLASYFGDSSNIQIEEKDNKFDIDHFVRIRLEQAIKEKRLIKGKVSDQLKEKIIETLTAGAQGMFRWVSLQIQNLCDPGRIRYEGDVVTELGRLPQTLAESYDITHNTISCSGEASRAVAERTLKWLMCAQRPLKLRELYAAVSVDLDGRYPIPSMEDLLDSCCNLVVVDTELQVFRFAHSSVRDYLESRKEYNVCETHALALTRCLDLLTVAPGAKILTPTETIWNNNFRQYAIAYWPMHYRAVEHKKPKGRSFENILQTSRQFLFEDQNAVFVQWISAAKALSQTLHWDDPLKETLNAIFSSPPAPLFLACLFGLVSIIEALGDCEGTDWDQRNTMGNNALHIAAANGHDKVLEILLDRGANLESETTRTKTALHKAAEHGHRATVNVLLQRGADVAAEDDRGATALHEASAHGHEAVVVLLLENGADCAAIDNRGGTALHVAARHGHVNVIQRLINCGVDVMARDASQWTALHGASGRGHEAVVRLLLDNGADTAASDAHGGTALHWASGLGHEPVVRLLLKHGADISAKDENGDTALHVSAGRGHELVVRLLLGNGADVESRTIYGGTPLQRAVSKNRKTVEDVLRQYCKEHGIDITEESMSVSPAVLAAHSDHFFCDHCDGTIPHSNIYYHCNICDDGDFDLCSDCFEKGILCYGDSHRLSKLSRGETMAPSNIEADHEEPGVDT